MAEAARWALGSAGGSGAAPARPVPKFLSVGPGVCCLQCFKCASCGLTCTSTSPTVHLVCDGIPSLSSSVLSTRDDVSNKNRLACYSSAPPPEQWHSIAGGCCGAQGRGEGSYI